MVTGKKKENITKGWLLSKVDPLSIFQAYMPWKFELNSMCKNPFTEKDRSPSMIIGTKKGEITFKCFNSEERGDCLQFVQYRYGLSFREALEKIAKDFNLLEGRIAENIPIKQFTPIVHKPKPPALIQVKAKPFSEAHLKWLESFHLSPRSLDIFPEVKMVAIKNWALNRLNMPLEKGEMAWAYIFKEKWVKIYRPEAKKKDKWLSSVPMDYIVGLEELEPCDKLLIVKSMKEAFLIYEHLGIKPLVIQAENLACFTQENIDRINSLCPNVYCSADADEPGKKFNWAVTYLTGWKHINVPDLYLKEGIKDWADLIYAHGPQPIIEHFKEKFI